MSTPTRNIHSRRDNFHLLQQDSEAKGSSTHDTQRAKSLTDTESPHSHILHASTLITRRLSQRAIVHRNSASIGIRRDLRVAAATPRRASTTTARRARTRERAGVLSRRVLRAARVLRSAVALAFGVTVAVGDALRAPFGADAVGERVAVLGDVGRNAVLADASVGEDVGVAIVGGGGACVAALVEADEWALGCLLLTPEVCGSEVRGLFRTECYAMDMYLVWILTPRMGQSGIVVVLWLRRGGVWWQLLLWRTSYLRLIVRYSVSIIVASFAVSNL